jgi:hypothetical protein
MASSHSIAGSGLTACNHRFESDHRHVKRWLRAMQGPRTATAAWAVIQGIERHRLYAEAKRSGSRVVSL